MPPLVSNGWMQVAFPAATALFCLAAVIVIASAAFMNRGAKVNLSWNLIALGLFLIGAAASDRVLAQFGVPNLGDFRDIASLLGALLAFCGAAYGRDLLKKLVK